MTSLRKIVDEKCKYCSYDPYTAGTWREQIALCCSVDCPLHPERPVPRQCRVNGEFDMAAINAIAEKVDRINRERARR